MFFGLLPSLKQFAKLPKVLTKKERYAVAVLLFVAVGSLAAMPITSYFHFTVPVSDFGGTVAEGVVGQPKQINPLLAHTNDADRDISKLVFAGLTKYDADGNIVADLAESFDVSEDGLTYTFKLKENLFWHDGRPLTADDVVSTILAIQNPAYNSPQLITWRTVEVSKVDTRTVTFKTKEKYGQFISNTSIGILPKHIWEEVKPVSFGLSEFNIKPVGSGPFKFKSFRKDENGNIISYTLESFDGYHGGRPYVNQIRFRFYSSEKDALDAYNDGDINSLVISARQTPLIKFRQKSNIHKIHLPRYFSIFFNQNQSEILADENVRMALSHAVDKMALTEKVFGGNAVVIDSPVLPEIFNIPPPQTAYDFNAAKAAEFLEKSDWLLPEDGGIRRKAGDEANEEESEELTIELTTSDWPELVEVGREIQKMWREAGVNLVLEILPLSELQQVIADKNYEALLFGELLSLDPDPYFFWHSSQKKNGLNLALYDDNEADELLIEASRILDPGQRALKYAEFQDVLLRSAPAIFLYSPDFVYVQSDKIKNNNTKIVSLPSDRFGSVNEWYIDIKRVRQ